MFSTSDATSHATSDAIPAPFPDSPDGTMICIPDPWPPAMLRLTRGLGHDLNNLLSVAVGNLELALETVSDDKPRDTLLRPALRSVLRGCELAERLLACAGRQALEPEMVDPGPFLHKVGALLKHAVGRHHQVEVWSEPGLAPCWIDPGRVETALLNLAQNARDAMSEGGVLKLEAAGAGQGEFIRFSVSDTGCGMTEEVLRHAVEPFFTTRRERSGLGLSVVHGFVRQSRGELRIESRTGSGTRVHLLLPRTVPAAGVSK